VRQGRTELWAESNHGLAAGLGPNLCKLAEEWGIYASMVVTGVTEELSATEVANLVGVPAATIRSWERRYGWPRPARTTGGHRRYSSAEIANVRALRDEIAKGRSAQQAVTLLRRQASRRRGVEVGRLVQGAVDIDQALVRRALADVEATMNLDEAVESVVIPALREIGLQWEKGACDIAGEHAATGQIRQWLGRLLDEARPRGAAPTVVLSTGPADYHSANLEAFAVLLARRGCNPLVLGALTPVASLVQAVRTLSAEGVIVVSHMGITRRAALDSITTVSGLRQTQVFYAGNGFAAARSRKGVPGTYLGAEMGPAATLVAERVGFSGGTGGGR
jgi:MerR family transcriptional regulator, light-induced transcriptional regulator